MSELSNQQLLQVAQQKISEYEKLIAEKNLYLSRLEMDLEHAIRQCKKIAADKMQTYCTTTMRG